MHRSFRRIPVSGLFTIKVPMPFRYRKVLLRFLRIKTGRAVRPDSFSCSIHDNRILHLNSIVCVHPLNSRAILFIALLFGRVVRLAACESGTNNPYLKGVCRSRETEKINCYYECINCADWAHLRNR